MPTFDTPEPIFATLELAVGAVRINASDRTDTVVEVRPSNEANSADVQAAQQTQVDCTKGKLWVRTPKSKGRSHFGRGGSVDVTIDLPTGSRVDAKAAADFRCEGRLGDSTFKTTGDIRVDEGGKLKLSSASGDISVAHSVGSADISTASGDIRIGEIEGKAVVKTAYGDITVSEVTRDLRMITASGDIHVDRALASVDARTPYGDIRIAEVVRGSIALDTASGGVEVGIHEGSAAWLDLHSRSGTVRNVLDACDGPEASDETVKVRARTVSGDIVIRRSSPASLRAS